MKRYLLILLILVVMSSLPAWELSRPAKAGALSAVLPGGGQIYNKQFVKAGLVIGIQGFLIGSAIHHDNKRDDYRSLASSTSDPFDQQYYDILANDYSDKLRSDFWWMGITAALSVIDAWVDAHLVDFDRERDRIHLKFDGKQIILSLEF